MLDAPTAPPPLAKPSAEGERAELWRWVHQLERLAELGVHSRGLVHDLGNTLTSLLAGLELSLLKQDETALRTAIAQSLDLARTAAARLHAHVDFTRRARKEEPPLALENALEDALSIIAHPLRKMATCIERDCHDAVCATGSHPQVVQVVVNALLAVLGSLDGVAPTLELHVAVEEGEAVLEIRGQNGRGRVDPANRGPVADCTGLELEVARRIVASYGGRLDLSLEERRARLALPAAGCEPPRETAAQDALATWRPASGWALPRSPTPSRP